MSTIPHEPLVRLVMATISSALSKGFETSITKVEGPDHCTIETSDGVVIDIRLAARRNRTR